MTTLRLVVAAMFVLALAACGSGDPAPAGPGNPVVPTTSTPRLGGCADALVVLGQPDHAARAAAALSDDETRLNATAGPADIVLFAVSVNDGPMPRTREQIEALDGVGHGPAAIMLVDVTAGTDPEIRDLVLAEMHTMLTSNGQPGDLPVLDAADANVGLAIDGLRARCPG